MKILNNMYKFTDTNEDISNSLAYKTLEVAENGDYKEFKRLYKLMGYELDFTPFLKKFLVMGKNDNCYRVVYALNKTNIFDNLYISRNYVVDVLEDTRHKVLGL